MKVFLNGFYLIMFLLFSFSSLHALGDTSNGSNAEQIAKKIAEKKLKGYIYQSIQPLKDRQGYFQALLLDSNKNDMSLIILPTGFPLGPVPTKYVNEVINVGPVKRNNGNKKIMSLQEAREEVNKYLSNLKGFKILKEDEIKLSNEILIYNFTISDSADNQFEIEYSSYGIKKHLTYKEKI